jgi:hypothetical protein
MDNWFSSPDLYSKLWSKKTDAKGTMCKNRKGDADEIKKEV